MIKTVIYTGTLLLATSSLVMGQDKKLDTKQEKIINYVLTDADSYAKSLLRKKYTKEEVYSKFGDIFNELGEAKKAAIWYKKAFEIDRANIETPYFYKYALSLKSIGNYDLSDQYMDQFTALAPTDIRGQLYKSQKDYLKKIEAAKDKFSLTTVPFNSKVSDIAPSYYKDALVFSTARDSGMVKKKLTNVEDESFQKLFKTLKKEDGKYSRAEKFLKGIESKFNESSAAFTKDGQTIYFTSTNTNKGKIGRDNEGYSRLKLYKAVLKDTLWSNVEELPFNDDGYSVAHPALSPDEQTLYFTSDMPGTLGGSDIFSVSILADGSYGNPINLGNTINTEGRETFPYVSEKNELYFASNGHPGLGGLDIFVTTFDSYCVFNLGSGINSSHDESGFIINEQHQIGYVSSNRAGGKGDYDIYAVQQLGKLDMSCVQGIVNSIKDKATGKPMANVMMRLLDINNNEVARGTTDENGMVSLEANYANTPFKMLVSKEGYEPLEHNFTMNNSAKEIPLDLALVLKDAGTNTLGINGGIAYQTEAAQGTKLVEYLELQPIYFDLDKYTLTNTGKESLDKIAAYMAAFSELKLAIKSHTDAKGARYYNENLSKKRAKETKNYLVLQGVSKARLSTEGFGETQLLNNCKDWTKCTLEQNRENRRSELIVVK